MRFALTTAALAAAKTLNVYGDEIVPCSQRGMAKTGFTRTGACEEANDDAGSHHVCVDIRKDENSGDYNFCQITGQPNWCDAKGECYEEPGQLCGRKDWCVCEWAFRAYVKAKGCDAVHGLQCQSTNALTLSQYCEEARREGAGGPTRAALQCLQDKCTAKPLVHTCDFSVQSEDS